MLQIIDKFKQVNRHRRLGKIGYEKRPSGQRQTCEEEGFDRQGTACVNRTSTERTFHLTRDGLEDMVVHAAPHGRK